jgi:sulfatase modifying factor 1
VIRRTLALALLTVGCGQPSDGEVAVKGGSYIPDNDAIYPEEARGGPVAVADFSIDRHEVTNRQFAEFVKTTGYVTQAERGFPDRLDIPPEQRVPGGAVFLMPAPGRNPGWTFMPGANWRHPDGPDSAIEGQDDMPVVQVTVADALAYARWKGRDLPDRS